MEFNSLKVLTETSDVLSSTYGVENDVMSIGALLMQKKDAYSEFVSTLAEGIHEGEREDFIKFAENCSDHKLELSMFGENTSSTFSKFAILDNLVLREIWNRTGARSAMTYSVADAPLFQIPFVKQMMRGPNGELLPIPQALEANSLSGKVFDAKFKFTTTDVFVKKNAFLNFTTGGAEVDNQGAANPHKIDNPYGKMTLDKRGIVYGIVVNEGGTAVADDKDQTLPLIIETDSEGNFFKEVIFKAKEDTDDTMYTATLMGKVDKRTGDIIFSTNGDKIKSINFKVKVSVETNRFTHEVEVFTEKEIIEIGNGDTINSTVPVQYITDMKKVLKLDALSEISKVISNSFIQIYDKEVYNTFVDAIVTDEQKSAFNASMIYNNAHIGISRQMHNANLLDKIVKATAIIDNVYNFSDGLEYYAICNPIENGIISSSIAPDYAGTVSKGGVVKPYTSGQVVGSVGQSDIRVISSKNYKPGTVIVVPKPAVASEVAFGYYDYSQVLLPLGSYRNERNDLVPNIAMNKRKVIKAFRPEATHAITVTNSTQDV